MALNRLLWYCLNQGNVLREPGQKSGVSLDSPKNERVVFFRTDADEFRKYFKAPNEKVCDGLVFYRLDGQRPRFIFVELKSDDPGEARDQIDNTAKLVMKHVPPELPKPTRIGLVILKHGVHRSRNRKDKRGAKIPIRDIGFPVFQKSGVNAVINLRTIKGVLED